MKEIITKYEGEVITEPNDGNGLLFDMLEDFALRNNTDERSVLRLTFENGHKTIKAADYVGLLQFNDGTQLEIYPKIGNSTGQAKKMLGRMMSAYLDIPFETNLADMLQKPESSFMEFFISVFVRECMKIMKSGLLSGYTTVEENSNAMQGSIIFSENIRKNLTHRERLYVRHDVFTPDRSENRLIKSAAAVMIKLTRNHRNEQDLKKLLIYFDEVKLSVNCEADFVNCINTRNTKKYSAVLNICRMLLKKQNGGFSGKYVSNAILFPMRDIFNAYILRLVKDKCRDKIVRSQFSGAFMCGERRLFPVSPDIAVYDKNNNILCIIDTCWRFLQSENDILRSDIYRLYACGKKFECGNIIVVYPAYTESSDMSFAIDCGGTMNITVKFAKLAEEVRASENVSEAVSKPEKAVQSETAGKKVKVVMRRKKL